jgi:hypothetical protein
MGEQHLKIETWIQIGLELEDIVRLGESVSKRLRMNVLSSLSAQSNRKTVDKRPALDSVRSLSFSEQEQSEVWTVDSEGMVAEVF